MIQESETIVIGGGLAGLSTAYLLTNQGYGVTLVEKSRELGGLTGSFRDELGNVFDYGYHALDYNRSVFTTNLFRRLLGDKVRKVKLRRGLLLENQLVDYNAPTANWPERLRKLLPKSEIADDIGSTPKRNDLERVYGKPFTDLIFERVLRSYAALRWKLENGIPEDELLELIYPWYFPLSAKLGGRDREWHRYHDRIRAGEEQEVLYPSAGGFGQILRALEAGINRDNFKLLSGVDSLSYEFDPGTRSIRKVVADGNEFRSRQIYWCAPIAVLCKQFGIALPEMKPQEFVLGSFAFSSEVDGRYHEILAGDPEHPIDRISFPCALSGAPNQLIQIEYFFPEGEFSLSKEDWKARWLAGLVRLGLVKETNEPANFDFKVMKRGFVTKASYEEVVRICRDKIPHPESNIFVPFWGVGPENINRLIPSVFQNVMNHVCE